MIRNWLKNEEAATAVEFAMIAMPFCYLLIGIIEMSLMFVGMSTLDSATDQAARLIRTGQVQQTNGDPEQMFKDALCNASSTFLNCSLIEYEVVRMDGFADFSNYPASYDELGNFQSQGFDAGSVNDVILIRATYKYPLITPLIGSLLADGDGKSKRFISTVVLETEPYDVEQVVDSL